MKLVAVKLQQQKAPFQYNSTIKRGIKGIKRGIKGVFQTGVQFKKGGEAVLSICGGGWISSVEIAYLLLVFQYLQSTKCWYNIHEVAYGWERNNTRRIWQGINAYQSDIIIFFYAPLLLLSSKETHRTYLVIKQGHNIQPIKQLEFYPILLNSIYFKAAQFVFCFMNTYC